jgi:predicted Zn finger-like uncharacterized protein
MTGKTQTHQTIQATRIEVVQKDGVVHHRIVCPYCKRTFIFRVDSSYYPKGSTMKCPECKKTFKKFERVLKKEN